jgi:mannan endo-1,4-beta-mannosidase
LTRNPMHISCILPALSRHHVTAALTALAVLLSATFVSAQVNRVLSSSHYSGVTPSAQAQNLYDFLTGMENNARNGIKQTIIGQHSQVHKETYPGQYYDRVGTITGGKLPGFLELDFGPGKYHSSYNEPYIQQAMNRAIDVWNAGDSIIGYAFHMSVPGSPSKAFEYNFPGPQNDAAWFARTVDKANNTIEYQRLIHELSFAADGLQQFKDADVPIIFRPFHEMNKLVDPFWWGNRNPDDYKKLWNVAHEYLVEERGLDNLLFTWCPYEWDGTYGANPWAFYPGDDKVDIVGVDIYEGNPYFPAKFYTDMANLNKPRILGENNKMPVRWSDVAFPQNVSEIDARPYVIWTIWGNLLEYNLDETTPNQWNVSSNNKAIRDTYNYYSQADGIWRVLSGGPNGSFDFSFLSKVALIEGDFNRDGLVDAADYTVWRDMLGKTGDDLLADGNGDKVVDQQDFTVWKSNFGRSAFGQGTSSVALPEPSTAAIIVLGAVAAKFGLRPFSRCGSNTFRRAGGRCVEAPPIGVRRIPRRP